MANYTTTGSDTFPAGHIIKSAGKWYENGSELNTTSTSFVDTAVEVTHVTVESSSNSYIEYQFYTGMTYQGTENSRGEITCTMRTASNSTYEANESISAASYPWFLKMETSDPQYLAGLTFRVPCGLETGQGMPATKSSWAAGDTLYFRLFMRTDAGTFRVAHGSTMYNATTREIRR